jgi:hypothetical protein
MFFCSPLGTADTSEILVYGTLSFENEDGNGESGIVGPGLVRCLGGTIRIAAGVKFSASLSTRMIWDGCNIVVLAGAECEPDGMVTILNSTTVEGVGLFIFGPNSVSSFADDGSSYAWDVSSVSVHGFLSIPGSVAYAVGVGKTLLMAFGTSGELSVAGMFIDGLWYLHLFFFPFSLVFSWPLYRDFDFPKHEHYLVCFRRNVYVRWKCDYSSSWSSASFSGWQFREGWRCCAVLRR